MTFKRSFADVLKSSSKRVCLPPTCSMEEQMFLAHVEVLFLKCYILILKIYILGFPVTSFLHVTTSQTSIPIFFIKKGVTVGVRGDGKCLFGAISKN